MAIVPDGASETHTHAALPLSWRSLAALLGDEFGHARLIGIAPVSVRSRNQLFRATLDGVPIRSLIVKVVRQQDDRFWEHHLRREHWLLELLERRWPGGAPRPCAAAFGRGWGLIAMEDVGVVCLADLLSAGPSMGDRPPAPLLQEALTRLVALHGVLRAEHRIFFRVCHSVELDRITATSLLARVRVAHRRLQRIGARQSAGTALSPAILRRYAARVARPLASGPRQMIHNSLSPLNIVLGPAPRFVDWETMAYAAAEFDVADLLCYPAADLPWPVIDQMAVAAFGPTIDLARLRLAALARALDYAGSNAQQAARFEDAGDSAPARQVGARRDWYVKAGQLLAEELDLQALFEGITY